MKDCKDIHTEHCCLIHGCKYGNSDCTVAIGDKQQSFPCEYCDEEKETNLIAVELYNILKDVLLLWEY